MIVGELSQEQLELIRMAFDGSLRMGNKQKLERLEKDIEGILENWQPEVDH
jgi:hypothetical protein